MSELSTATKHWKAKYDRANRVGVALSLVTLLLAFFNVMQALAAATPLPPPTAENRRSTSMGNAAQRYAKNQSLFIE
jgi:hypothetical protein